jgi:flagellar protein FlgJ
MIDAPRSQYPLMNYRNEMLVDELRNQNSLEKIKQNQKFGEILKKELNRAGKPSKEKTEDKELLNICYEMESIFIGNMLDAMRKTIDESDFFGKSIAKDIFRDMLYDEYAKVMARSDQLGLARQIYDQLNIKSDSLFPNNT